MYSPYNNARTGGYYCDNPSCCDWFRTRQAHSIHQSRSKKGCAGYDAIPAAIYERRLRNARIGASTHSRSAVGIETTQEALPSPTQTGWAGQIYEQENASQQGHLRQETQPYESAYGYENAQGRDTVQAYSIVREYDATQGYDTVYGLENTHIYGSGIQPNLEYTQPNAESLYAENPWREVSAERLWTEGPPQPEEYSTIGGTFNLFTNLFDSGTQNTQEGSFADRDETQLVWTNPGIWNDIELNPGPQWSSNPGNLFGNEQLEAMGIEETGIGLIADVQPITNEEEADTAGAANEVNLSEPTKAERVQLYDPLEEGGEPQYTRRECDDGFVYEYASAGKIINSARKTRWEIQREINDKDNQGNVHGIWKTAREQGDAEWMSRGKASQAYLTELLKTERFAQDPPDFKTVKNLNKIIETKLSQFGGPKFKSVKVRLPGAESDLHTLVWREPQRTLDHLIGTPRFAGKMSFAPKILIGKDGVRRYGNMDTAEFWNLRQRALPLGTTLGAGIMMSDSAQLSQYTGDVSAHGVYASLGNIDKSVREDINEGAWLLVAIIPKSNWDKTLTAMDPMSRKRRASVVTMLNRRLFHHCMRIITESFRTAEPHKVLDPEGNVRSVQYELSAYGADLEEQCDILGISRNSCPHGEVSGKGLGNLKCPPRSSQTILAKIDKVIADWRTNHYDNGPTPIEFMDAGKKYGLSGVDNPFWADLPHFDVCRVLSPDLLHGIHKLFYDHYNRWNINSIGAEEYDTRLKAQIPTPGERMFVQGVTKLKQLAGKDWRALFRVHLAIMAGAGSNRLTKATRAMADCISYAQLRVHTEETLEAFERSLLILEREKEIWIQNGSKTGKKGRLNKDWAIPKKHIMGHIPEHIRQKGTMDNYTTETMEHLHSPVLKDGYKASNRKEWLLQVIRRLNRHESMREYREFLDWLQKLKKAEEMEVDPPKDNDRDDEDDHADDHSEDGDDDDKYEYNFNDEDDDSDYKDDDEDDDEDDDYEDEDEDDEWEEGYDQVNEEGCEEGGDDRDGNLVQGDEQRRPGGQDTQGPGHPERPECPERPEQGECELEGPLVNQLDAANDVFEPRSACPGGDSIQNTNTSNALFPTTVAPHYRVAKKPVVKPQSVNEIERRLGFPKFLQHLQQHPYFATLPIRITPATLVNIWKLIYVTTPASPYCTTERVCRIFSHSGLEEKNPRRWDAAFYIKTNSEISVRTPETEVIHDYAVGRIALLFALRPSAELPEPRLMAYVQKFSPIPKRATGVSGFYAVERLRDQRSDQSRFEVIAVSQIARPCPLSPQIKAEVPLVNYGWDLKRSSTLLVEDGAVFSNILSRLRTPKDLHKLLKAYQNLRLPRTSESQKSARLNQFIFHIPDGPEQEARGADMTRAIKWKEEGLRREHKARDGRLRDSSEDPS
ncbi:hypothetical protein RhiJN_25721 [Ceratobasidium sp. AG-Ba]|nr:hypothetical protein RhiJN_25721 [Ceratobasidium sp. AG-Ba]